MEQPTQVKRRGRPPLPKDRLADNPNAANVRAYRARKKAADEAKYLQDQRVYSAHYNQHFKEIRAAKPDYSGDPIYNQYKPAQPEGSEPDETVSVHSDEDPADTPPPSPSVTGPGEGGEGGEGGELDAQLDEEIANAQKDNDHSRKKNKKRREKIKALLKGNKMPADAQPVKLIDLNSLAGPPPLSVSH